MAEAERNPTHTWEMRAFSHDGEVPIGLELGDGADGEHLEGIHCPLLLVASNASEHEQPSPCRPSFAEERRGMKMKPLKQISERLSLQEFLAME